MAAVRRHKALILRINASGVFRRIGGREVAAVRSAELAAISGADGGLITAAQCWAAGSWRPCNPIRITRQQRSCWSAKSVLACG